MKTFALIAMLCSALVCASCDRTRGSGAVQEPVAVERAALCADARDLKDTIVTPHLEQRIDPGKNVLWCATFQLAWNELIRFNGGPVQLRSEPAMVRVLNRGRNIDFKLDRASYVARAGVVGDGVIRTIRQELGERFAGDAVPRLLPSEGDLPPIAVVLYSYMLKCLPFRWTFTPMGSVTFETETGGGHGGHGAGTAAGEVKSFGIHQYIADDSGERNQGSQVRVIWHRFRLNKAQDDWDQQFVIELLTVSETDRMILAKVTPGENLASTVQQVLERMKTPNRVKPEGFDDSEWTRRLFDPNAELSDDEKKRIVGELQSATSKVSGLLPLENLEIPVVDFDLTKQYRALLGRVVVSANPRLDGMPFMEAKQRVRFRLDEKGARLESEFFGSLFGGTLRGFYFDRPFLIMLIRNGAATPYFALWVGNTELLVPAKKRSHRSRIGMSARARNRTRNDVYKDAQDGRCADPAGGCVGADPGDPAAA